MNFHPLDVPCRVWMGGGRARRFGGSFTELVGPSSPLDQRELIA